PLVSSSSVITRRRIVVLPEPLGPMRVTRSPGATVKLRFLSTVFLPKLFSTSLNSMAGFDDADAAEASAADGVFSVGGKALLQSWDEHGFWIAGVEEDDSAQGQCFGVGELGGAELLGGRDEFDDGDREEERRVLEHGHRVVAQRRNRRTQGLRQHHCGELAHRRQG